MDFHINSETVWVVLEFLKKESSDWPPSDRLPKNKALFRRIDSLDNASSMEERTPPSLLR